MAVRLQAPFLLLLMACQLTAERRWDVVVYGGTAGGIMAAVSAAREGLKTVLLEPGSHIGGMVSGGLGNTDSGRKEVIGGLALEFYFRMGRQYDMSRYGHDIAWLHEPHVAEQIFQQMLDEARVTQLRHHRLREHDGVRKEGSKIVEITTENGATFGAAVFIDSSYEGDLMAQSGVSYTWGRESSSQYNEALAGVRNQTPLHQFLVNVSPRGIGGELLPEISSRQPDPPGSADRAVQAYNFRMCLSDVRQNQRPFAKPAAYESRRYALLARLIEARTKVEGKTPALRTLIKISRLPNGKSDINNEGAFSTDYIGGSWDYPEASYAKRAEIWLAHRNYTAGLFYFLAADPSVPESLRAEMSLWGLCKDEFVDTDNWPHQLYIREARRMIGEYVLTQKDLQTELTKPDSIGLGSYNSDSHNVERIVASDGFVRNEGDMQVPVTPYQIPYRVMLPKREQASNLLVPVAFSASHVAYSSLRMEPQYMILGQASGVAAKLAISAGKSVQAIEAAALTAALRERGATTEYDLSIQSGLLRRLRSEFKK